MTNNIYSDVNTLEDLRRINRSIRREMGSAHNRAELTELKKRADYLVTLTHAPSWQEKFGRRVGRLRAIAVAEDRKTTERANRKARREGWDGAYHAWGQAA